MDKKNDLSQEGHTREWQDRARVELHPEKDITKMASPNQSPQEQEQRYENEESENNDPVY